MKRLLVSSIAALSLVTACGVAEDTTAATVDGHEISVSAVSKLAKSEFIIGQASAGEGLSSSGDVVVGSATRRVALRYLVETAVYESGVKARKGKVTDVDTQAAEQQISQAEAQNQTTIDSTARPSLVRWLAAQAALGRLIGGDDIVSAASPDKVEAYFDDHQDELATVCVDGFVVPTEKAAAAQAAVDGGDDVATILANTSLQASPLTQQGGETCVRSGQVQSVELADLVVAGKVGVWGSTTVSNQAQDDATVFLRPNSRTTPSLDDPEITDLITQTLQQQATAVAQEAFGTEAAAILERADVEIDSRYGRWDPTNQADLIPAPLAPKPSAQAAGGLSAEDLAGLTAQ